MIEYNKNNKNILFNILIRNTYRPSYFKKCIKSLLSQTYINYKIIMSYDDENCLEYLNEYKDNEKIEIFKASNVDKSKPFFYNLYCNELLDKVQDGWIIFLDDDDMFTHENSLLFLSRYILNENNLVFWKFKRQID